MTQSYDFNKALAALKAELEQHLESDSQPNLKNGRARKLLNHR